MTHTNRDARGFSLLELMMVVAIGGLLMAITIPSVRGFLRAARVTGAAAVLTEDMRYARAIASAQRKTYAITFGSGTYSLVRLSPAATIRTRSLPRGVTCTATDSAKFYPWGLSAPMTATMAGPGRTNVVRLLANGSVSHD